MFRKGIEILKLSLIALAHILVALALTLIALAHLNSTMKMHRLHSLYKNRNRNPILNPKIESLCPLKVICVH